MNNYYTPKFNFGLKSINTAFKRVFDAGYFFRGEVHDFWEMCFVLKGNATVTENKNVYELSDNDAVFHRPLEFHAEKVPENSPAEYMIISFSYEGNEIDPLGDGIINLSLRQREKLISILCDIHENFDIQTGTLNKRKESNKINEKKIFLEFECFLLDLIKSPKPIKRQENSAAALHYKNTFVTLQKHITENLTLDDIAALCLLGKSNLKKVFKTYTGCGVMQYFNKMKISKAIELMKEEKSISEISDILSFSSPNYFSCVFKKETGMLPSQYRREKF